MTGARRSVVRRLAGATVLSLIAAACNGHDVTATAGPTTSAQTPVAIAFGMQPVGVNACEPLPSIQVAVTGASGVPVASYAGEVTVEITPNTGLAGATLSGTRTARAVAGIATFSDLSINVPGTLFRLTAHAAGLTAVNSTPFSVAQGPAVRLAFVSIPTSGVVGTTLATVRVAAQDACGGTMYVPSRTIALVFGNNPGGGPLSGTTALTSVQGVATFSDLVVTRPGAAYTLIASTPGLTSATSPSFTVGGPP